MHMTGQSRGTERCCKKTHGQPRSMDVPNHRELGQANTQTHFSATGATLPVSARMTRLCLFVFVFLTAASWPLRLIHPLSHGGCINHFLIARETVGLREVAHHCCSEDPDGEYPPHLLFLLQINWVQSP